jgi:hypothetical protein
MFQVPPAGDYARFEIHPIFKDTVTSLIKDKDRILFDPTTNLASFVNQSNIVDSPARL